MTVLTHHEQIRADRRIGYGALFGDGQDGTGDEGQIPGQLGITDIEGATGQSGASA